MLQGQPLSPSSRVRAYLPRLHALDAAVQAWAGAVKRTGTFEATRVAAVPTSGSIDTAIATVRFDFKGDNAASGVIVYRWRDNTVEAVAQT